jgi:glycosyltransferase involved in cell wall biosynthesis
MRVLHINLAFERVADGGALLDRYHTLTGLCGAQVAAGARVDVLARFWRHEDLTRDGVLYHLRKDDPGRLLPKPLARLPALWHEAAALEPDVVHVHGLSFPVALARLRLALGAKAVVVAQDHANRPSRVPKRWVQRLLLRAADGFFFTGDGLAEPWRAHGIVGARQPVYEIVEAASALDPVPHEEARRATGIQGAPAVLWVGRLHPRKDPLVAVEGFVRALDRLPDATLSMVFQSGDLLEAVEAVRRRSPRLAERIRLVGPIAHERLAEWFSAADLFVTTSPAEGSNYALIEAITCGLYPVCSDIPAHRSVTAGGTFGRLFPAGSAHAFAEALEDAAPRVVAEGPALRQALLAHAAARLSWHAIAAQTLSAYADLLSKRGGHGAI